MRLFAATALFALLASAATLVDDEIAALVRRIEALSDKESAAARIATLTHAANLLDKASPVKAADLRTRARALRKARQDPSPAPPAASRDALEQALQSGDRGRIEQAAERFLSEVEHGADNPDDYAWFAEFRKRHGIVKGGDNASVRAREALSELAELVRTDLGFELGDLHGATIPLQASPGAITVISFWATWCGPCVEELPIFDRVSRAYASRQVRFIGVTDEPVETVRAFVSAHPVRYPVLLDSRRGLFNRYHVESMPALIILDGTGRLRYQTNRIAEVELTGVLDRVLQKNN